MTACEWEVCSGEAHDNPYVDNCMRCAPHWGKVPICPECECRLVLSKSGRTGECEACQAMDAPYRFKVKS